MSVCVCVYVCWQQVVPAAFEKCICFSLINLDPLLSIHGYEKGLLRKGCEGGGGGEECRFSQRGERVCEKQVCRSSLLSLSPLVLALSLSLSLSLSTSLPLSVCQLIHPSFSVTLFCLRQRIPCRESERERERKCVCVCV